MSLFFQTSLKPWISIVCMFHLCDYINLIVLAIAMVTNKMWFFSCNRPWFTTHVYNMWYLLCQILHWNCDLTLSCAICCTNVIYVTINTTYMYIAIDEIQKVYFTHVMSWTYCVKKSHFILANKQHLSWI
jgi:hypothetical protein